MSDPKHLLTPGELTAAADALVSAREGLAGTRRIALALLTHVAAQDEELEQLRAAKAADRERVREVVGGMFRDRLRERGFTNCFGIESDRIIDAIASRVADALAVPVRGLSDALRDSSTTPTERAPRPHRGPRAADRRTGGLAEVGHVLAAVPGGRMTTPTSKAIHEAFMAGRSVAELVAAHGIPQAEVEDAIRVMSAAGASARLSVAMQKHDDTIRRADRLSLDLESERALHRHWVSLSCDRCRTRLFVSSAMPCAAGALERALLSLASDWVFTDETLRSLDTESALWAEPQRSRDLCSHCRDLESTGFEEMPTRRRSPHAPRK